MRINKLQQQQTITPCVPIPYQFSPRSKPLICRAKCIQKKGISSRPNSSITNLLSRHDAKPKELCKTKTTKQNNKTQNHVYPSSLANASDCIPREHSAMKGMKMSNSGSPTTLTQLKEKCNEMPCQCQ
ncbi:hypothetical protein VTJ04DRAFT_1214 [Mycothermus thermophilus]|uniref:uncharacterized protein n=1 Tax=Humicola insolens TaxID=85995 RepID=UPI003743325B